jgi:hypothetical protein
MHRWASADTLHRTGKLLIDAGEAASLEEAEQKLNGYCLAVIVGKDIAHSPTLQAMLLTIVNTGRRCFLGGVFVVGDVNVRLQVPWNGFLTLAQAILSLQGHLTKSPREDIPTIVIGDVSNTTLHKFAIRATYNGWSAGIAPLGDMIRLPERQEFTPSGVFAGALAVSEAFHFHKGYRIAGHREVGMSLWSPTAESSWTDPNYFGPELKLLPSGIWILGLGHLGQAFLWTLGFLPYADPQEVHVVLQDFDFLTPANDSTSPLTFNSMIGMKKARAMASWCDARGFRSTVVERAFNGPLKLQPDEPQLAFCGVDNSYARSKLEESGFKLVFEAGLGSGPEEFCSFQMHTFPGPKDARTIWGSGSDANMTESLVSKPAYEELRNSGMGECGLATLAGRSVGASFVGTGTTAIVVADIMRYLVTGEIHAVIDGSFKSIHNRTALRNYAAGNQINPGFTFANG